MDSDWEKFIEQIRETKEAANKRFDSIEATINKSQARIEATQAKMEAMQPGFDHIPDMAERLGESKNWWVISMVVNFIFSFLLFMYCLKR